jgi:hypothetical protein
MGAGLKLNPDPLIGMIEPDATNILACILSLLCFVRGHTYTVPSHFGTSTVNNFVLANSSPMIRHGAIR